MWYNFLKLMHLKTIKFKIINYSFFYWKFNEYWLIYKLSKKYIKKINIVLKIYTNIKNDALIIKWSIFINLNSYIFTTIKNITKKWQIRNIFKNTIDVFNVLKLKKIFKKEMYFNLL